MSWSRRLSARDYQTFSRENLVLLPFSSLITSVNLSYNSCWPQLCTFLFFKFIGTDPNAPNTRPTRITFVLKFNPTQNWGCRVRITITKLLKYILQRRLLLLNYRYRYCYHHHYLFIYFGFPISICSAITIIINYLFIFGVHNLLFCYNGSIVSYYPGWLTRK